VPVQGCILLYFTLLYFTLLRKGTFLNLYRSHTIIKILNSKSYYGLEMWLYEAQNDCLENFVRKPHEKSHFTYREVDGRLKFPYEEKSMNVVDK
jgi:hypothetical protein